MKYEFQKCMIFIVFLMLGVSLNAQTRITGNVQSDNGFPLAGVTVIEKGTSNGATTDFDGNFNIDMKSSQNQLVFSYIGFISQTLEVPNDGELKVVLKEDLQQLSEVVIVGYGQVQKKDLTGSVSTVDPKEFDDIPSNSIERVLQGRVAGLQISTPSQDPGAGSTVRIRGGSSLRGSNAPLIVVDGFPLGDAGDLKQINPADIEKVDVLKDASASAIYGSRGANGVIIVTTKTAKKGKTEIRVQQQSSFSQFNSEVDLWRDPVLMAQLSNEARLNGGFQPLYAKNGHSIPPTAD